MRYTPRLGRKKIEENHRYFSERVLLYKKKGLDLVKSREFILRKAQPLPGSILELGTGAGHTTVALAKAGYDFVSIDKDKEAEVYVLSVNNGNRSVPTILFADGSILVEPSNNILKEKIKTIYG